MCVFCRVCLSGFGINTLLDVFEEDVEFIILDDMPKSSKSKKWNPFIVKDNHLEHILEKKTSEVFTTDVLSALLER